MRFQISVAGALMGACLLVVPATAAPLAGALSKDLAPSVQAGDDLIPVQFGGGTSRSNPAGVNRGGNRGGGGGGNYHRGGGGRGGYHGHGGGGDDGAGVAAGVLGGLLLGAIIANEAQRGQGVDYCMRRYRSYDPQSMTYMGNDGRRHSCP
jgi:hypothetical protein